MAVAHHGLGCPCYAVDPIPPGWVRPTLDDLSLFIGTQQADAHTRNIKLRAWAGNVSNYSRAVHR